MNRLRGSRGNQNYSVPADVQFGRPLTVLIWCRPYSVRVAAATLR
jgi:electron transfer DM13